MRFGMRDVSKTLNRNQFQSCRIETVPLVVSSYKRTWLRKMSEITCFGPGIIHVIGHPQQITIACSHNRTLGGYSSLK